MKLIFFYFLLIAAVALPLSGCTGSPDNYGNSGKSKTPEPGKLDYENFVTLKGVVLESDSGIPIESALVALAGSGEVFNTTTDGDGRFALQVPSGKYAVLTVFKKGYTMELMKDVTVGSDMELRIQLRQVEERYKS